jgi:hypothetical protein
MERGTNPQHVCAHHSAVQLMDHPADFRSSTSPVPAESFPATIRGRPSCHSADQRLPTRLHGDVLDAHGLLSDLSSLSRQCLDLHRERPKELGCQVAECRKEVRPVRLTRPLEHRHRQVVAADHLHGEHAFNFVSRPDAGENGKRRIALPVSVVSWCGARSLIKEQCHGMRVSGPEGGYEARVL